MALFLNFIQELSVAPNETIKLNSQLTRKLRMLSINKRNENVKNLHNYLKGSVCEWAKMLFMSKNNRFHRLTLLFPTKQPPEVTKFAINGHQVGIIFFNPLS